MHKGGKTFEVFSLKSRLVTFFFRDFFVMELETFADRIAFLRGNITKSFEYPDYITENNLIDTRTRIMNSS